MIIRPEALKALREQYPAGTRVRLVRMNDEFTNLQPGDEGTVEFVDDCGTIFCIYDCGSHLGAVFGVDELRKIGVNDDD
jgi:hypothetical protein